MSGRDLLCSVSQRGVDYFVDPPTFGYLLCELWNFLAKSRPRR